MDQRAGSSLQIDIAAAYFASAAKVLAWAAATSITLWYAGAEGLALLALVRSTIGLFNYITFGFGPATIHQLSQASKRPSEAGVVKTSRSGRVLDYAGYIYRSKKPPAPGFDVYAVGLALSGIFAILGGTLAWFYARHFTLFHQVPWYPPLDVIRSFVFLMGLGMVFRLTGDVCGARMQTLGYFWLDSLMIAVGELIFVLLAFQAGANAERLALHTFMTGLGGAYALSGLILLGARFGGAIVASPRDLIFRLSFRSTIAKALLGYGVLVTIAQLADFLYAPTDFILINRLLDPVIAAVYAPAVQLDAALLMLVTGVANALFPRASLAHAGNDRAAVRRYYVNGTLASAAVLFVATVVVWLIAPALFVLWLKKPFPETVRILPLILIHTIIGGSSAVGRSILLAIGKVKPFTIAVLLAGAANVILSFCFVYFFHLGLVGIILGTIVAVVARCGIWMPWYILRTLNRGDIHPESAVEASAIPEPL